MYAAKFGNKNVIELLLAQPGIEVNKMNKVIIELHRIIELLIIVLQ
jgi:hypothetical protein